MKLKPRYAKYLYPFLAIAVLFVFSACSPDIYSVVVSNPGVQHESNPLNDLPEPYHKKQAIFPTIVQQKDAAFQKMIEDSLKNLVVHTIDTTIKVSIGRVEVEASACGYDAIALVIIDKSELKSNGKKVDLKIRYVCSDSDFTAAWGVTDFYKIDASDMCMYGFHTIEFEMFAPDLVKDKALPDLQSVIAVCADL